jgi:hypothetical protein
MAAAPGTAADDHTGQADAARYRVSFGDLQLIAPPGTLDGQPLRWAHGPRRLGGDAGGWDRSER